mgnify:FL=1
MIGTLRAYMRFVRRFPDFLRRRVGVTEAQNILRRRMSNRDERFLRMLQRAVFGHAASPYCRLFELADCTFGDVKSSVCRKGLEATLQDLCDAGIYVTFEEFKGRRPIVRHGTEIATAPADFDNPFLTAYWSGSSSGTTGAATRTAIDLEHVLETAPFMIAAYAAHDVLDVPTAYWRGTLPGVAGLRGVLRSVVVGNPPRRWFSPVRDRDVCLPLTPRIATVGMITAAKALRRSLPMPELLPLNRPQPLVHWIRRTLDNEGRCMAYATVSSAARLALTARKEGVELRGCTIKAGGETITPAKVRCIKATGASWFPIYGMSEAGFVGMGCADTSAVDDDLHVAMDGLALIQRPLQVDGWPFAPDAFFLTSLLATAPKILLNLETDDCGVLEEHSCGCFIGQCGLTQHVRGVRSYRKVTGEGITLVDADMVKILEEVLPARFGGGPLDYQFVEEEDEKGLTRLSLLVSPRVKVASEGEVVNTILEAVRRAGLAGAFSAAFWEQGQSIRVRRREPLWNAGGKFLPLKATEALPEKPVASSPKGN